MQTLERIEDIVRRAGIPDYVVDLRIHLDTDSTGDPAVYIFFTITDEEADSPEFVTHMNALEASVFSVLKEAQIEEWPYFHIRTVSEEKEIEKELAEEIAAEERRELEEGVS